MSQLSGPNNKVISAFNLLKKATQRMKIKSFDQLAVGNYIVNSFKLHDTQYGLRLAVIVNAEIIYLPPRFSDAINTKELLDELNTAKYIMLYKGKDSKQKNWIDVDFDEIPDLDDEYDDSPKKLKIDEETTDVHYNQYMKGEGQDIDAYMQSAQFGYDTVDNN